MMSPVREVYAELERNPCSQNQTTLQYQKARHAHATLQLCKSFESGPIALVAYSGDRGFISPGSEVRILPPLLLYDRDLRATQGAFFWASGTSNGTSHSGSTRRSRHTEIAEKSPQTRQLS